MPAAAREISPGACGSRPIPRESPAPSAGAELPSAIACASERGVAGAMVQCRAPGQPFCSPAVPGAGGLPALGTLTLTNGRGGLSLETSRSSDGR